MAYNNNMSNETLDYFEKRFESVVRKLDEIGNMVYNLQKENAALKSLLARTFT